MKAFTAIALRSKQLFSIVMAVFVMMGGLIGNLFGGKKADTEENYRAKISQCGFYENTLETAIPQTKIANLVEKHFSSPMPEGKLVKKAIIIGYDGCRADAIDAKYTDGAINNLLANGGYAYIGYCGGANYPGKTIQATSTAPGWCSILTGSWADAHGVTGNGIPKSNDNLTLLTSLVKDKVIRSSAFYTMWSGHFTDNDSTYINERRYCEENRLNVTFKKDLFDAPTFNNTMADISKDDCSDFIFSILEGPDFYGHSTGFSPYNPIYNLGLKTDESYANTMIEAIEQRKDYRYEDWLIVLASDHGGINTGHGGESIQERMTFIVTNKEIETELGGQKPEKTYYDEYISDILNSPKYTLSGKQSLDNSTLLFTRYSDGSKSAVDACVTSGVVSIKFKMIIDGEKVIILIPMLKKYCITNASELSDLSDMSDIPEIMDSSQMNYLGLERGIDIIREVYKSEDGTSKIKFLFKNDTLFGIEIIDSNGEKTNYTFSLKSGVPEDAFTVPSDYKEMSKADFEKYLGGLSE